MNTEADSLKYEVLFGTITSDEAISDAVQARLKSVDASFSDSVQLVSLRGNNGNQIMHLHCGLLFQHSELIYFFEKTDPMLPFQLSLFPSTDMLKEYLLNRTDSFDNLVVFINDTVL